MLGNQIRTQRLAAGLNQTELATTLGVTRQAISSWEAGRSAPSLSALSALADTFCCSTDLLLERNTSSYYIPTFSLSDEEAQTVLKLVKLFEQKHSL